MGRSRTGSSAAGDRADEPERLAARHHRCRQVGIRWRVGEILARSVDADHRPAATARLIQEASSNENPPFVLGSTMAGALAAFDDRLLIVKAGAATGFMAGTLGGHRLATFYYTEINAIEYNAGMLNGVLQVLTASYQGSANSDYWRGTGQSRNADSNDPFTLSNTLPIDKITYRSVSPQMAELRQRINAARQPAASSSQASTASGLAGELAKLAELHVAGVLSDDEFSSAKARLLMGE